MGTHRRCSLGIRRRGGRVTRCGCVATHVPSTTPLREICSHEGQDFLFCTERRHFVGNPTDLSCGSGCIAIPSPCRINSRVPAALPLGPGFDCRALGVQVAHHDVPKGFSFVLSQGTICGSPYKGWVCRQIVPQDLELTSGDTRAEDT